jgi:hypothetical protein
MMEGGGIVKKLLRLSVTPGLKNNRGASAIVVAITLTLLLGFAALGIDVGYMMVARNELQNAADASALAATRQLGVIYKGIPLDQQWTYVCSDDCPTLIAAAATGTAASNKAAGLSVSVQGADIEIGRWDAGTKTLNTSFGMIRPDAVRVKTRRDATSGTGGPIGTFFARIFNKNEVPVTATATAALTSESTANYHDLELPVGISDEWAFECDKDIHFYPTNESCAGWTDFFTKKGVYDTNDKSQSDPDMKKLLEDIGSGAFPYTGMPPEVTLNDTLPFTGGNLSQQTFLAMDELFNSKKTCDADGNNCYWDTTVVVYDNPGDTPGSCGNPNDTYTIVGFAQLRMTMVFGAGGGKYLQGKLKCGFESGRGGGGSAEFGTMGDIPGLVQ